MSILVYFYLGWKIQVQWRKSQEKVQWKKSQEKKAIRDHKWKQSVTELTVCSSGMKVKRLESVVKQYFTVKDASVQSNELTRAWVFVIGRNYDWVFSMRLGIW